jgi:HPt (histidine-containing phosphotransfer) domain-containing protein
VSKPFNQKSLFEKISKWISLNNYTVMDRERKIMTDDIYGIDIKDALERVNYNEKLLIKLLQSFKKDYSNLYEEICNRLRLKDYDNLKKYIHTAKGVSSNISAYELESSLLKLEDMILNNVDISDLQLQEIYSISSRLMDSLDSLKSYKVEYNEKFDSDKSNRNNIDILKELYSLLKENSLESTDKFENLDLQVYDDNIKTIMLEIEDNIMNFDFEKAIKNLIAVSKELNFDLGGKENE